MSRLSSMRHTVCFIVALSGLALFAQPKLSTWLDESGDVAGYASMQSNLSRLSRSTRVMYIGLHPGDEPLALLAYLSHGRHAHVASLFLTYHERGQNQVGLERGDELRALRAAEALQAAQAINSEAFFIGLPDIGASKSATDALTQWNEDRAIQRIVACLRDVRPHIVLTSFTATTADAHGQQRAVGELVKRAFSRSGYASFATPGDEPWRPDALFLVGEQVPGRPQFSVDVAQESPSGKSYAQIAVKARAAYRSLDLPRVHGGLASVSLSLLTSRLKENPAKTSDPFDAFDRGPEDLTDPSLPRSRSWATKVKLNASAARELRAEPDRLLLHLVPGLAAARQASVLAAETNPSLSQEYAASAENFTRSLHEATGLRVDLRCDRAVARPGDIVNFSVHLFAPTYPVMKPRVTLTILLNDGMELRPMEFELVADSPEVSEALKRKKSAVFRGEVRIPDNMVPTASLTRANPWRLPYGRRHRTMSQLPIAYATVTYLAGYDIGSYATALSGAEDAPVTVSVEAYHLQRISNAAVRTPLRVLPDIDVALSRDVLPTFISPDGATCTVVTAIASSKDVPGVLTLEDVPPSWRISPTRVPLELQAGQAKTVSFKLDLPGKHVANAKPAVIRALFRAGRQRLSGSYRQIDQPHVPAYTVVHRAECSLSPLQVTLPAAQRVACVPGPDMNLIAAFEALSPQLTILQDGDLAARRFYGYDTIILAPGAYDYSNELVEAREGLLTYVLDGGRLVVFHQDPAFEVQNCAPFRLRYSSTATVTDENAPVKLLLPQHPLLQVPNGLSGVDFRNWEIERGRYFLDTASLPSAAQLPLSTNDPGDVAQQGGLVYVPLSKGEWIYCGYNLQEQLAHHVPGAWRILANLIGPPRAARSAAAQQAPEPEPPVAVTSAPAPAPVPAAPITAKPETPPPPEPTPEPRPKPKPPVVAVESVPPPPSEKVVDTPSVETVSVEPPPAAVKSLPVEVPKAPESGKPRVTLVEDDPTDDSEEPIPSTPAPPVPIQPPTPPKPDLAAAIGISPISLAPKAPAAPAEVPAVRGFRETGAVAAPIEHSKPTPKQPMTSGEPPAAPPPSPPVVAIERPTQPEGAVPPAPSPVKQPVPVKPSPPGAVSPPPTKEPTPPKTPVLPTPVSLTKETDMPKPAAVAVVAPPAPPLVAPKDPKTSITPEPAAPLLPDSPPDTEWPETIDLPPAPTQITAETVEYDMENGLAMFIGNVQVIDDRISLTSDRLRAANNPSTNEFKHITAEGNVRIVSEDRVAVGNKAVYDMEAGTIVLSGNPHMRQGLHEIVPEEAIVYDRRRGVFQTRGRVTIRLRSSGSLDDLR